MYAVLLIGAGLCVRCSLLNAHAASIQVLIPTTLCSPNSIPGGLEFTAKPRDGNSIAKLLERVQAIPGVESVSLANYLPLATERMAGKVCRYKVLSHRLEKRTSESVSSPSRLAT